VRILRFVSLQINSYFAVLIVCVSVAGTSGAQEQSRSQPEPNSEPCVGFLMPSSIGSYRPLPGDVFASCSGHAFQLTKTGDVLSWAIDPSRNRLVTVRENPKVQGSATMVITLLMAGKVESMRRVSQTTRAIHTCGTVMAIDAAAVGSKMLDVISGKPFVQEEEVVESRCDALQKTKIVLRSSGTLRGGPLLRENEVLGRLVSEFDVSPNGRFVSFNDDGKTCVYDADTKSKSCLEHFAQVGRMSVWDDGRLISAGETSQACPLSSKLVTASRGHPWPCPALFEWSGGTNSDWIQFLGTEPQLLPAETGRLLRQAHRQLDD